MLAVTFWTRPKFQLISPSKTYDHAVVMLRLTLRKIAKQSLHEMDTGR